MNLYFFGGTFDPPHLGHYNIVKKCLECSDKVVVIPNKTSVDKKAPIVNAVHRLNMLRLLFKDFNVEIDEFEIISQKKNYTIHTIEYLMAKYRNAKITMVIGSDQLNKISNWHRYDDIINFVEILCFNRLNDGDSNGDSNTQLSPDYKVVKNFKFDISSSKLRDSLKNIDYENTENFLNKNVYNYIKENNLYAR